MIWCIAPTVTWALVFGDPGGDSVTMRPMSAACYSEKLYCDMAAMAANSAFALDLSAHRAECIEQKAAGK